MRAVKISPLADALAVAIEDSRQHWQLSIEELADLTDTPVEVLEAAVDGLLPEMAARSLLVCLIGQAVDLLMANCVQWTAAEPSDN